MAKKPDIELVALTKRYGATAAVDSINLKIPAGSYCCLLGPSGCGKTTTLRMIAGHEDATEGDVILGSENITGLPPARRGTAMMFQSYALFPHLTCIDNVAFSLKMRGVAKGERRRRAAERLQIDLGITFIHVTHSQEEAMALADLVVVMDRGRILQVDAPRIAFNRPRTPFVARFIGGH